MAGAEVNIKTHPPAVVTAELSERQIQEGFELHVDNLTGDVSFHRKPYYEWRGTFKGPDAVSAAHNELSHVRQLLCWA